MLVAKVVEDAGHFIGLVGKPFKTMIADLVMEPATALANGDQRLINRADYGASGFVRVHDAIKVRARLEDAAVKIKSGPRKPDAGMTDDVALEVHSHQRRRRYLFPGQAERIHQ